MGSCEWQLEFLGEGGAEVVKEEPRAKGAEDATWECGTGPGGEPLWLVT